MEVSSEKIVTLFIFVIFITVGVLLFSSSETNANSKNYERMKIAVQEEAVLTIEEQETLDLINEYRRENGLTDLKAFKELQQVAKLKADDLVKNAYFAHNSEALGTPFEMLEDNGIGYAVAGENLCGNTTPERAVEAWINSMPHRENILDDEFEYTGVCVVDSPVYGRVFVQLFMGL